jgi:hypothetical protein
VAATYARPQPGATLTGGGDNPMVMLALAAFLGYRLTINATDTCDAAVSLSVTVFSDELPLGREKPVAWVTPGPGTSSTERRWIVRLLKEATIACNNRATLCELPDGRVYTVVVCAKNRAGLSTCQELTAGVSVPARQALTPTSQGKLFTVLQYTAPVI